MRGEFGAPLNHGDTAMAKKNLPNKAKRSSGKQAGVPSVFAIAAMSAFALGAGVSATTAQASIAPQERDGEAQSYRIPAGSMANALNTFADMNGLQLLYDAGVTERLTTSELIGQYSMTEGLDRLLSGTGLTYRFASKHHAVSIMLAQNDTGTQSDAGGGITLPTVDVTASQQGAGGAGGGSGTGCGPYGGAPCSGFGGAGLAQDPFNPSYVLPDASVGTKTDTPVMDTPLNVQSVSQQVLQDQQAITLGQALQNFSGVSVTDGAFFVNGTGSSGILVRGFLSSTYYRDGFRVDSSLNETDNISTQQLANVASIEVLKGPGAVLYGLIDPGGIVNVVTKEPLDVPYFAVQQQIGSLALYRTTVDATGPLTDDKSVLYRMNMSYENNGAPFGSFVDLTHSQSLFLAPVVKWNIDGATWVKLEAQYNQYRSDSYYPFDPLFNGAFVNIPRSTNYGESSPFLQTNFFTALTWSHNFNNDWSIKQQLAYDNIGNSGNATVPVFIVSPVPPLQVFRSSLQAQSPQTTISTNVDITGHFNTFGAEHTLLLGGDIYRTTGITLDDLYAFTTIDLFNAVHLGIPSPAFSFPSATAFTQDTAGLYLQDQIKLPYNFYLLAGARYQYIHQTAASGGSLDDLLPQGNPLTGEAVTPRFGLLWRPQEWVSFYANYTEGYGPNNGFVFPGVLAAPTSAESSEAGVKLEFFNGKLRVTADYFDLVKTNVPINDPAHPAPECGGGGCVTLIGEARSKGPELDIQGEILPGWSVIANYTNDDVRAVQGTGGGPSAQTVAPGQRFPLVPRNLANFWTTYEFQDETFKGLKIGAGYHYTGSRPVYDAAGNPPGTFPLVPAYGTVDLMAAYSFKYAGANLTAQLNITNLFDTAYYQSVVNEVTLPAPGFAGLFNLRSYGAPFSVVGSLRAQYPADASSPFSPPPPPPVFSWTGFYAGAQAGYAWGDNNGTIAYATPGGLSGDTSFGNDAQGVIGGAHAGYNTQIDTFVIGVEGTVDPTTLYRNVLALPPSAETNLGIGNTVNGSVQSTIQGSIRARAGYAFDRLLLYGTGGAAFGAFKSYFQLYGTDLNKAAMPPVGPNFYASDTSSATRVGWTAGGGIEYALNNNWSVEAEYRYSDFGHITDVPSVATGLTYTANRHLTQNQVQTGFSYKFDSYSPETGAVPAGPAPFDFSRIQISQIDTPQPVPVPAPPADRPPPPVFTSGWTGFYAGAQIGYAWGDNNGTVAYATPGGLSGNLPLDHDVQGVIGGIHAGYNYQIDQFVTGVEGTVDPTTLYRNVVLTAPDTVADPTGTLGIGNTVNDSIQSTIQGAIRARAGITFDRVLFYGTGGVAFGAFNSYSQQYGIDLNLAPFYASDRRSLSRVGWTAGGGVEYAIDNNYSVTGEYRYSDFGRITDLPASASGLTYTANRHLTQNQVQVGLSYKFAGFAPAPVVPHN